MIGRICASPLRPEHRTVIEIVHIFCFDRSNIGLAAPKDILNATFTLLPEYENCRSAALATNGHAYDAVENFDAFTESRKPVRRHR